MQTSRLDPITARDFWQVLGQRPLGVCVVAARDRNGPRGFLGLSAAHVCADPPTMLVSVNRTTSALETLLAANHFAVSVLPRGAEAIAEFFAGRGELKGGERFKSAEWTTIQTGAPVFKQAVGALDCIVTDVLQRGTVVVAFGLVVGFSLNLTGDPLVAFRGRYL